ncbi:hypothetical protein BGX28_002609 [Mortierella sp. GBA30]|nr:hypothetical protein BGX28_002609 [Mortierella sp. GBA30]
MKAQDLCYEVVGAHKTLQIQVLLQLRMHFDRGAVAAENIALICQGPLEDQKRPRKSMPAARTKEQVPRQHHRRPPPPQAGPSAAAKVKGSGAELSTQEDCFGWPLRNLLGPALP